MRTYAALSALSKVKVDAFQRAQYPHVLVAFVFDKTQRIFERLGYPISNAMLDSGAHSAWTRGLEIDIDKYIEWSKAYAEKIPNVRITNLDVIPGAKGRNPTPRQRKRAVAESVDNANRIRAAGLRVIEVHHIYDPVESWEAMIERRQPGEVLGLGGLNAVRFNKKVLTDAFGDACFARIKSMCGWDAVPPVHGFGVAVSQIGYRYPLASIDASSWISPEQYGHILDQGRLRRFQGRPSHKYLKHENVKVEEINKIFRMWLKREDDVRQFWQGRGVTILDEGAARVDVAA